MLNSKCKVQNYRSKAKPLDYIMAIKSPTETVASATTSLAKQTSLSLITSL